MTAAPDTPSTPRNDDPTRNAGDASRRVLAFAYSRPALGAPRAGLLGVAAFVTLAWVARVSVATSREVLDVLGRRPATLFNLQHRGLVLSLPAKRRWWTVTPYGVDVARAEFVLRRAELACFGVVDVPEPAWARPSAKVLLALTDRRLTAQDVGPLGGRAERVEWLDEHGGLLPAAWPPDALTGGWAPHKRVDRARYRAAFLPPEAAVVPPSPKHEQTAREEARRAKRPTPPVSHPPRSRQLPSGDGSWWT